MYVYEELNDKGVGGDLNDYGDDERYLDNKMREVELQISRVLLGYDGIYQSDEGGINSVLLHDGDTMDPDEFRVPKPPYGWVDSDPNT